ncbi:NAD(P)/FAD-dependent oxidoreductase [Limobrevibacterium gyesilva]|uniref:FAD-binding oxidoreductase n=1 Tax=Limobrevibacterium gyesilva TaxID=2991712 RepID=A0AA41YJA4_9PROT|nr:FAD-binding oxidoreductase [Limobrevibacterium gyesilva]MCW3473595.1 FAD-binding oxidoreductase [Limobrevibacterium gyesilva]
MGPQVDPVQSDAQLPSRTGVVVVGGGIIGTSTAYFLAAKGVPVVLCEKGQIAGEQSSRNWGWVRKQGRDPRELPLIIESLRLWQGMNATTGAETGFRTTGILYLCETDKDVAEREAWLEYARLHQLDTRMIGPDEVDALVPGATRRYKAGLYTPSDGRAEPQKATPAIAEAARRAGALVFAECAVRGIETAGGRVAAAVTERGRIACDSVVLAGGAWSRLFCGNLGVALPQLKVRSSVMRTAPLQGAPDVAAVGHRFAFRKRLDGGYTIANGFSTYAEIVPDSFRLFFDFLPALRLEWETLHLRLGERFIEEWRTPRRWPLDQSTPFEAVRMLDPAPVEGDLAQARSALSNAFPAFANVAVAQQWAGLIDVTPDAVPVISPVDSLPGFFVATGFSGHGFGIGPGAGRLMADLVTGDAPVVDPSPFRLSRFADRPRPRPHAGL